MVCSETLQRPEDRGMKQRARAAFSSSLEAMIRAKKYVFSSGSRITCDVSCDEIAIFDGGVERIPTDEEIAAHSNGFRLFVRAWRLVIRGSRTN
jgi:hypothetical protein